MSAVTSTETRGSPDVLTTFLRHEASRRSKKRVCSKSTQAQPPWWILCRGRSKLSPKHPCQDLREEGALQPGVGVPAQNLLSNTEFSHPTGLCQEKPSDHRGGDRPFPLVIQVKQPSESSWRDAVHVQVAEGLGGSRTHSQSARGGQAGGERPSRNHITRTKRTLTAAVKGSLPA